MGIEITSPVESASPPPSIESSTLSIEDNLPPSLIPVGADVGSNSPQATEIASDATANDSTSNQGLVIGLSVAGALLLLIAMIFLIWRHTGQRYKDIVPFKVIKSHSPILDDEIELNIGDIVVLKEKFSDGWAMGVNITTQSEGSFPSNCISELEEPRDS